LLAAVRPHRGLLAAAIASMIALSAATGAFSWLVGPMFQFVFKGGALDAKALRSALPFLSAPEALPRDTVLRALPILLLAIAAVPLTVVPIVRFARRLKKIATRGQAQIGTLYTLLHEALQGVRIVQSFGMERYEREKFSAEQDRFLATMRRSFFVRAIF